MRLKEAKEAAKMVRGVVEAEDYADLFWLQKLREETINEFGGWVFLL